MPTVLITLGRLPKALDLARGFAAAGCRVIIAEPFGLHLSLVSRAVSASYKVPAPTIDRAAYLDALAVIVAREAVDLVVPVSEETMHAAFLADRLGPKVPVFTMPPAAVLAQHDKAGFVHKAAACGVAAPQTHPLGTPAAAGLAQTHDVIVKPVFGCAGRGMRVIKRGDSLPLADPDNPAIVQVLVSGALFSTCTLASAGRAVATSIYRGTVMSGSVAIAFARVAAHPPIEAWVNAYVAASHWTGFISFDLIVDATGAVFGIECNPRATSGLHFWRSDDVARCILSPRRDLAVRFRPELELQHFYSTLTEAQAAMIRGAGFGGQLRRLVSTRDVSWDWRDPLPFLTMPFTSWQILRLAVARRARFGEVAMLDLGWYGPSGKAG
jgi:predicted ATP-grasp superfamily ATP-dependent carboligase